MNRKNTMIAVLVMIMCAGIGIRYYLSAEENREGETVLAEKDMPAGIEERISTEGRNMILLTADCLTALKTAKSETVYEDTMIDDADSEPVSAASETIINNETLALQQQNQYTEPAHVHNFDIPIYETRSVYHHEEGHIEIRVVDTNWVIDRPAWDEPVTVEAYICQKCEWYTLDGPQMDVHILREHNGESSWRVGPVPTGEYIHHEEEGHTEEITEYVWVVDKPAWTEEQEYVSGYMCECGATQ